MERSIPAMNGIRNQFLAHSRKIEHSLLSWCVVDDHDVILNVNCNQEKLCNKLRNRYSIHAYAFEYQTGNEQGVWTDGETTLRICEDSLPVDDMHFNAVLCTYNKFAVMTHDLFSELFRVLKPGGHVIIAFSFAYSALAEGFSNSAAGSRLSAEERLRLIREMERIGFKNIQIQRTGLFTGVRSEERRVGKEAQSAFKSLDLSLSLLK